MQNYIVTEKTHLLDFLIKTFPDSSKTTLRSWLKEGRITVDGTPVKQGDYSLRINQKICLISKTRHLDEEIKILYEDNDLVVVDKPSGILSVAAAFDKEKTVHSILKTKYKPNKVYVIHRLDQETSGVMLFALSERAYTKLKEIFEKHEIERKYTAIVQGCVRPLKGTWQSYQWEDANYVVHTTDDPSKGRIAITHYLVRGASKKYTWLELTLETGRKNQIRVHCTEAGYPVIGDRKYGAEVNPLKRLALHAHLLAFHHPISDKKMKFQSPLPEPFNRILNEFEELHAS